MTITVTGVNDAPVAGQDTYTTPDNAVLDSLQSPTVNGLLANDSDPENEAISVLVGSSDSVSRLGASRHDSDQRRVRVRSAVVRPAAGAEARRSGRDRYLCLRGGGRLGSVDQGDRHRHGDGCQLGPVPAPDQYSTAENVVLVISAPGVLANDTDPDSTTLSAVSRRFPASTARRSRCVPTAGSRYDPRLADPAGLGDRPVVAGLVLRTKSATTAAPPPWGRSRSIVSGFSDPPYQNAANNYDVNGDGIVSPIDALILINYINANGQGPIPAGRPRPPYLDVNGDGWATADDVIMVVNA